MYCSKCGSKLNENAAFCHNCGKQINENATSKVNSKSMSGELSISSRIFKTNPRFRFIVAYGIEWLGIIISLFSPICAYYHDYGNKDISNYCTVFGGSWAYITSNYDPISTPEKGHRYAQFFAIIFLAAAILCLLMAVLKKRYISSHLLTIFAYALYSGLTLNTARRYFTKLDSKCIKFTGMYIFATVLIAISLFLIIIFSANRKMLNGSKTGS